MLRFCSVEYIISSSYSPNVIVCHVHEARGNSDGRKRKSDSCSDNKILFPQIAGSGRVRKLRHANHTIIWHAYSRQIISILCSFFRY